MAGAYLNKSDEFLKMQPQHQTKHIPKGQLISKCLFGVIVLTKIGTRML